LVGVCSRAWSPPLAIVWRGADGAGVEKGGLPACPKTGERLLGSRFTSKRSPVQRLERFDFLVTLLAPLRVDGALGLWLARLRREKDPALRHAPRRRQPAARAIPLLQRRPGRRLRLGQDLLGLGPGRWAPGDPLEAGIGQLVPVFSALEGPVGPQRGGAEGGVERRHVVADNLAERFAIATLATQGLQQQRDTGLVRYDSCQHPLVEVRAMIPPLAVGDVHDLVVGGLSAVIPAINMETRRSEMADRGHQPQTPGRRGGNEAVEGCHPSLVQRIAGAPEGVIIERAGLHAWSNEASDGRILKKMGDEGELVVEKAQPVKHHGLDRMTCGYNPHFRVLLCRCINDLGDAEFFQPARDQTQGI
jgi:hypothetical protein